MVTGAATTTPSYGMRDAVGRVCAIARSEEKLDAAEGGIAIDEIDAFEADLDGALDHGQVMRGPGGKERLLVGAHLDVVHRRPGHVERLLVVPLVDLRRLQDMMTAAPGLLAVGT